MRKGEQIGLEDAGFGNNEDRFGSKENVQDLVLGSQIKINAINFWYFHRGVVIFFLEINMTYLGIKKFEIK